jgi:hypothetical protein
MSNPTLGDVNVRGYVLPDGCAGDIEALESTYGRQSPDTANPLVFYVLGGVDLPQNAEVLFDIVLDWQGKPYASNVRAV